MAAKTRKDDAETAQRILDAATERFVQFGYNKTTMAEIAQSCDMSAANLYRYFQNKLDIGANLAGNCLSSKLAQLSEVVQQQDRPAGERLQALVLRSLEYTYGEWSGNPRMNEMVTAICAERHDIVKQYKAGEHALLVTLLESGIQRGEFSVPDVDDAASAIATATSIFNLPTMMPMYPLEVFREKANSVVRLLLNGLLKRQH